MSHRPVFLAAAGCMIFAMQLGSSCTSDTHVYEERRVYVEPPPPPAPPVIREDVHVYQGGPPVPPPPPVREYVRDYPDHDNPRGIPRWAEVVKDDKGKIRWTANESGTFYVYDVDKDFIRYSGPVQRGQEVIVQPGDDIIYVDQRIATHENLRHDARHRIYFAVTRTDHGAEADRGDGRKTGGAGDPGRTIPKGSVRLASGRGDLVINGAAHKGTVYVYDEDSRNVIYTADIDRGNNFQLLAKRGIVNVNSKRVAEITVPPGHTISLYIKE